MMEAVCKDRGGLEELTGVKMWFDEGGNEFDGLSHLLGIGDCILRVRRILLARQHDSAIDVLALDLSAGLGGGRISASLNSKTFNFQFTSGVASGRLQDSPLIIRILLLH